MVRADAVHARAEHTHRQFANWLLFLPSSPFVAPMSQTLASAGLLVFAPLPLLSEIHPQKTRNQEDSEASNLAGENISKPDPNQNSHSAAIKRYTPA